MNSSLDNVYELLRLGYGDSYRLEDIKQRLENGKVLYGSDNDYLQKLVYQYRGKIQKVVEHKKPKPTPKPTRIPEPEPTLPKKKGSKRKKLLLFCILFVGLYYVGDYFANSPSEVMVEHVGLTHGEYLELSIPWTYEDVLRNPEKYDGEILNIIGTVKYVSDRGGDRQYLALTKKCGAHPYNLICDYAIVDYTGQRILQGDTISSFGYLDGVQKSWPQGKPSPMIKSVFLFCKNCD